MKIYFTSFSNLKTEITKQLTEYCNVTSLNPKTTEAGEKLCQYVGKRCCPKCSVDRLGWYMLFFFDHHVAEERCWPTFLEPPQKCWLTLG